MGFPLGFPISLANGNGAVWMRLFLLAGQVLILAGVFWAGATFVHKSDFEAYKAEQENRRAEEFKTIASISETMARIDERLKNEERSKR